MTTKFKYLTVNAFRREFFAAGSRPRRVDVLSWIDAGALPAVIIDGVVYIKDDDATAFFNRNAAPTHTVETARAAISQRKTRIEKARLVLSQYGL